jgi:superoxide reductase
MRRRGFLLTAGAAGASGLLGSAFTAGASAQPRASGPPGRRDWSPTGPRRGREASGGLLTAEERAHLPVVTLPDLLRRGRGFDLAVQVGSPTHAMAADHHIQWIEVAIDDRPVAVADLTPAVPWPVLRVPLVLDGDAELRVRARCNEHGVWMTRAALRVT